MRALKAHPSIIELKDVVRDPASKSISLVKHANIKIFDHLDNIDFRSVIPNMSDLDIRFYLFELLKVHIIVARPWTFATAEESCTET